MHRLRLAIFTLVGGLMATVSATSAQAQFYGNMGYRLGGYGAHQYSGTYASSYGAYPFNSWYAGAGYGVPAYGYGYTRSYGIGAAYGPSYGIAGPLLVAPNPIYGTTTTIIRGGPTGGVIQYTHNGNGYTYVPDSTYPTVIQQQPTLGLSRTYVVPSPPPVVVESRPQRSNNYGLSDETTIRSQSPATPGRSAGTIKLICPKTAAGPLLYSLNGHVFKIQPGYTQKFPDDRIWTLEFDRGNADPETASYSLKAGTYTFVVTDRGWELQQGTVSPGSVSSDLPPAPLPEPAPVAPNSLPSAAGSPTVLPPSPLPPQ